MPLDYLPDVAGPERLPGWLRALVAFTDTIVVITLVVQLAILLLDVLGRVFQGFYFAPTLEISQLDMIVLTFGGAVSAHGRGELVAVQVLQEWLPARVRSIIASGTEAIVLVIVCLVAYLSVGMVQAAASQLTPVLAMSVAWIYLPIPIAMTLIAVISAYRLARMPIRSTVVGVPSAGLLALVFVLAANLVGPVTDPTTGILLLFGIVLLLLILGVPIAICLLGGTFAYLYASNIAAPIAIPNNMAQAVNSFVLLAVPFFVLVGFLLANTGLSKRLTDALTACVGRVYGGLHQVLIVGVFIFSGLTGAKVADIVAVGAPMQKVLSQERYPPAESAAILAASAAAGETIPPSIALLVLGSVTTVSITSLFTAGILPGAFISVALMIVVWFRSRRRGLRRDEPVNPREAAVKVGRAVPVLIIPVLIVAGIVSGVATPTEVSAVAVVLTTLCAFVIGDRGWWSRLPKTLAQSASMSGMILFLVACAGASSWSLTLSQLPQTLATDLTSIQGGRVVFILVSVAALLLFGAILEGLPAIVIFGPLLVPVAQSLGISTIQYSIVLIIALGVGAFAPPLGVGFTVASAVMRVPVHLAARAMLPYLVVLLVAILVIAFVPAITLAI